jgi:PGF-CTERM protein
MSPEQTNETAEAADGTGSGNGTQSPGASGPGFGLVTTILALVLAVVLTRRR